MSWKGTCSCTNLEGGWDNARLLRYELKEQTCEYIEVWQSINGNCIKHKVISRLRVFRDPIGPQNVAPQAADMFFSIETSNQYLLPRDLLTLHVVPPSTETIPLKSSKHLNSSTKNLAQKQNLCGGFKYFIFTPTREMVKFDQDISTGLKPPPRNGWISMVITSAWWSWRRLYMQRCQMQRTGWQEIGSDISEKTLPCFFCVGAGKSWGLWKFCVSSGASKTWMNGMMILLTPFDQSWI